MFNLFKNVIRSLKKNKFAIIGLTFLVFLSSAIFTTLNSTTTSINKEYERISKEGNLHNFTTSELYNVGSIKYNNSAETQKIKEEDVKTPLYNKKKLVKSKDDQIFPLFDVSKEGEKCSITSHYILDYDNISPDSIIRKFYENPTMREKYSTLLEPSVEIEMEYTKIKSSYDYCADITKQVPYGLEEENKSPMTSGEIETLLEKFDYATINDKLLTYSNQLSKIVSEQNTPLSSYLEDKEEGLGDDVQFRRFKSLNITSSPDKIFYKSVLSNPTDKIDKIVNIKKAKDEGTEWNNVDTKECTYNILDYKNNENYSLNDTLSYIPEKILDPFDIHYIEKIYLMERTEWGQAPESNPIYTKNKEIINNEVVPTNDEKRQEWWEQKKSLLEELLSLEKEYKEQVFLKDYRVTLKWTTTSGVPYTCYINNWSSLFTVVNPEYASSKKIHALTKKVYENNDTYKEYIKNNPQINDDKIKFIGWLNSLSYPEITKWFEKAAIDYKDECFISPGGATPYLVLGTGITADFIYPIVSIAKPTPNPENECIFFSNDAGYGRIEDSFASSETENYIVGTFNSNKIQTHKKIIDQINKKAEEIMIFPHGTKAAYMADDTTNFLNASAFRIAYIPKFIGGINKISSTLTIFIVLLCMAICAIVIQRYIANNQTTLGIMNANGVSKWMIALSLLPFAIIPTITGGILGVVCGVLLQIPVLGLFKNYWMLPTTVAKLSLLSVFTSVIISFLFFSIIILITTLIKFNKKPTELMKENSQDNITNTAKFVKMFAWKFGVITKFRIAIAFQSLWKLMVLATITSLSLSSLVFSLCINGKFESSMSATNNSRNYSYTIDLYTPTKEGGQYIPTRYDVDENENFMGVGQSGFHKAGNDDRDINYTQSSYYGNPYTMPIVGTVPGLNYGGIMPEVELGGRKETLNAFINKVYYFSSQVLSLQGMDKFQEALKIDNAPTNTTIMSNLFIPYAGDSIGEKYDLFYLKNRTLTKTSLDYMVGVEALHIQSNPWDIAAALMPENVKNMCQGQSKHLMNNIGKALFNEIKDTDPEKTQIEKFREIIETKGGGVDKYQQFLKNVSLDPNIKEYVIDTSKAVCSPLAVALKPNLIALLKYAYCYQPFAMIEYSITYNTVPLTDTEETYTYLKGNVGHSEKKVKVMGIKADEDHSSKYVDLRNEAGKEIINSIKYTQEDLDLNKPFPIIINAYAAHKHGLKIGDTVNMSIDNSSERIQHDIKLENKQSDEEYINKASFKVSEICTTYEGEEYFTNQDIANLILKLKSHLLTEKKSQPNNFYDYELETLNDDVLGFEVDKEGLDTKSSLLNLSDYTAEKDGYNITPYGFNGIFTDSPDGGAALTRNMSLYSPSGMYSASDKVTSETFRNLLKFGSNIQTLNRIVNNNDSKLYNEINDAYNKFIDSNTKENHDKLTGFEAQLIQLLSHHYGEVQYQSLISGALDNDSNKRIYSNISNTVTQITYVTLVVVSMMVIIIVFLISNMIINDSKKLASILKALGYKDRENIGSFLSIYIPVMILGIIFAALLTWGLLNIYNSIVFNSIGIWLNAKVKWYYYVESLIAICAVFAISGINGILILRRNKITESIK